MTYSEPRGEDGWWWNPNEPGAVGNHMNANGHIDMMVCCPYLPEVFEEPNQIILKSGYSPFNPPVRKPNFLVRCLLILACAFDFRNMGKDHTINWYNNRWEITF